jgi:diguanylate cyclase
MSPGDNRFLDTMTLAEAAFGEITRRGQAADPRSFALWYKYAAADSGLLCAAVNTRLARGGTLSAQDIDELHSAHICPADATLKVDKLGARIADEIAQVAAVIEAAEGSASSYSEQLTTVSKRLETVHDREGARALVEALTRACKAMEATNAKLQEQMQATCEEVAQLRRELESVRAESLADPLTTLGTRKFFDAALDKAIAECHAGNQPLSLLIADIDHFKAINETFGRVVGDRVLRFVAGTLRDTITGKDVAARYGAEEFAAIMPRTPLRIAVEIADELRLAVMKAELVRRSTGEKQTRLTVSIGVAALHTRTSPQALREAAELCLFAAKRSGRNCVIGERDERLLTAMAG